jgi:hypothetical protein
MSILYRYKKQGEEGFKKLVYKLERTLPRRRSSILMSLWLEDPVYTQYLKSNFINMNNIFDREGENLQNIADHLEHKHRTLFFAFFDTPMEKLFLKYFDNEWRDLAYEDLKYRFSDNSKIQLAQRNTAYSNLFECFRMLQEEYVIPRTSWKFPPLEVLKGKHIQYPVRGDFVLPFEDGTTALKGQIQDKLRSGEWLHFYPNGQLIASGIYHLGEREHEWTIYYNDGSLKSKGIYIEGNKDGQWLMVDEDGIEYYENFEKGKQVA